jgi:endo-1,4-beta-xylanase
MKKRVTAMFLALSFIMTITVSAAPTTLTRNTITSISGWDVEFWTDGGNSIGTMVFNGDGSFNCQWNAVPNINILFRAGRKFGGAASVRQSHTQIGEISLTYNATHTTSVNSFTCVYGWTARNTVEWYIIESWGTYAKGRQSSQAQLVGTYTIPGEGTYEFYVSHERVNVPSIFSNTDTFPQYFSIRTERRTGGTVSVSEHFRQWAALGHGMDGALYEVAFCVEAWGSAGSAEVSSLSLTINGVTIGTEATGTEPAPEPTSNTTPVTAQDPVAPLTPAQDPVAPLTTADALIVLQASVGLITLTPVQRARYHLLATGNVTAADALMVLRRAVGLV